MPRRFLTLLIVVALAPGTGSGAASGGNLPAPPAPLLLQSPARFIPPPPPPPPTLSERAVSLARSQLGAPYVYGGASPSGFDCSGLVMWVYGRLGVDLPHNAAALYSVSRQVSPARLRPGDLVFFHGLGHVGIYIGHGRMIHAPQTGRNVEIEALGVRSQPLAGARRIRATI